MKHKNVILILSTVFLFTGIAFPKTTISVTVPVLSNVSSNNRPANFNWEFASPSGKSLRTGQFACGSYWVSPAEGEKSVILISLKGSEKEGQNDLITMDSDPKPHSNGLLHLGTKTYSNNNPSEDDLLRLPVEYDLDKKNILSLVSCMQRNESETSGGGTRAIVGGAADAYCIVTLLKSPPPESGRNSIRPSFIGDNKKLLTWDNFALSRLPAHDFIGRIDLEDMEEQRIRWNHSTEVFSMKTWDGNSWESYSEGGRAFRPHILHHNYAAGRAASINSAMMMLMGTNSIAEKKPLLASILAQGLDTWHFVYDNPSNPGAWNSGAGQWIGQFMPTAFAAALTINPETANALKSVTVQNYTESLDLRGPQEIRQILRGNTGVILWGDGHEPNPEASSKIPQQTTRYWTELKSGKCYTGALENCSSSVGQKTAADPHGYIDGPPASPGTSYMSVSAGGQRAFAAIMILFPEVRRIINSDDVIEYVDRLHREGIWTALDPVAPIPEIDQLNGCNTWESGKNCEEYRLNWGPKLDDARFAVENGVGRYTEMHGKKLNYAYTTTLVEWNWDSIISLYDGKTFEDKVTDVDQCVSPDIYIYPVNGDKYVYMRTGTFDGKIHYRLDGKLPTETDPVFSGPVKLPETATITAITLHHEKAKSEISSAYHNTDPRGLIISPSDLESSQK